MKKMKKKIIFDFCPKQWQILLEIFVGLSAAREKGFLNTLYQNYKNVDQSQSTSRACVA
jgi:hypothetical protein